MDLSLPWGTAPRGSQQQSTKGASRKNGRNTLSFIRSGLRQHRQSHSSFGDRRKWRAAFPADLERGVYRRPADRGAESAIYDFGRNDANPREGHGTISCPLRPSRWMRAAPSWRSSRAGNRQTHFSRLPDTLHPTEGQAWANSTLPKDEGRRARSRSVLRPGKGASRLCRQSKRRISLPYFNRRPALADE